MLEELQKHLNKLVHEQNHRPIADFEGYSPAEMHAILHFTFEESSPISLRKLEAADCRKIPLLNQIIYLAKLIEGEGELKLTKLGFLPTKVVAEIFGQDFIQEKYVDRRRLKQFKEADIPSITVHQLA